MQVQSPNLGPAKLLIMSTDCVRVTRVLVKTQKRQGVVNNRSSLRCRGDVGDRAPSLTDGVSAVPGSGPVGGVLRRHSARRPLVVPELPLGLRAVAAGQPALAGGGACGRWGGALECGGGSRGAVGGGLGVVLLVSDEVLHDDVLQPGDSGQPL